MALTLERLDGPDALDAAAADWDRAIEATGADIQFSRPWVRTWWDHFGRGRLLCLLVRDGGTPLAALPFAIGRAGPVRLARFAGSDPNYVAMTAPVAAGEAGDAALTLALAALANTADIRADAVSLSPLSGRSALPQRVREAAPEAGFRVVRDDSRRPHTVTPLPDDFDTWLKGLSKSRRREYRRDLKKLAEACAPDEPVTRTVTGDPDETAAAFDAFARLHTEQWQAAGRSGHFHEWPGSEAFYRDLVRALAPSGRARIDEHRTGHGTGDRLLSSQLSFVQNGTCWWRLVGRSTDPELMQAGIGRLGLVERIRDLIGEGVTLIEQGAGQYEYKSSYGGEEVPLKRMVLARDSLGPRLGTAALIGWADALDLGYYRGWRLKAAPRLGMAARPLAQAWIRTRL